MKNKKAKTAQRKTVNADEVARFDALGDEWWNEEGSMKPLHAMNPLRIKYIRNQVIAHFKLENSLRNPFKDLNFLDVGCGGGLLAEPLARLGADVTGIDAGEENIRVAKAHAHTAKLDINYMAVTAEELAAKKQTFDVVTALEIIEHVEQPALFLESCAKLLKKNGLLIVSTFNRTAKSYLMGIVAAEYVMRWVPVGTHDWQKFIKPSEMARMLESADMWPANVTGMVYSPRAMDFSLSEKDFDVNYLMAFVKA